MIQTYSLPPGSLGFPIIGETLHLIKDPQNFARKRYEKYGEVFKTSIFGQKTIYVAGADVCQFVFKHDNRFFYNQPIPTFKKLFGPHALANQNGPQHRNRRQILQKVFSRKYLELQIPIIEEITKEYLDRWEQMGQFAWYPELRSYSFDIACKLFIGETNETLKQHLKTWSEGLFSFALPLPNSPFRKAMQARKAILKELEILIEQYQTKPETKQNALSQLLYTQADNGNQLSKAEVKDQLLNLLAAGNETVASGLTTFCLALGEQPQWQEKSYLNRNYIEKCLKESLRYLPPAGGGFRKIIAGCEWNGFQFPQGWNLIYDIGLTHQSEFLNPEEFQPDRFQDGNPFAYIPFANGERRCLGEHLAYLEMELFATQLIANYTWTLPKQNLKIAQFPFPHPEDNLIVKLNKRS